MYQGDGNGNQTSGGATFAPAHSPRPSPPPPPQQPHTWVRQAGGRPRRRGARWQTAGGSSLRWRKWAVSFGAVALTWPKTKCQLLVRPHQFFLSRSLPPCAIRRRAERATGPPGLDAAAISTPLSRRYAACAARIVAISAIYSTWCLPTSPLPHRCPLQIAATASRARKQSKPRREAGQAAPSSRPLDYPPCPCVCLQARQCVK